MNSSIIPDISSIIKRTPGIKEIEAILELLPTPTLLIDTKSSQILLANSKSTELTAYTKAELNEIKINTLLPTFSEINTASTDQTTNNETILIQRSGLPTVVKIETNLLGNQNQWQILSLVKSTLIQQLEVEEALKNQRWNALYILTKAPLNKSPDEAYQKILQAGQLLTGASILGYYLPSHQEKKLRLKYYWGDKSLFPEIIDIAEVDHLRLPFIWEPGKRALSAIHRAALAAKVNYIGSIAIEENKPQEGLLILGDQITSPPSDIEAYLHILAGTISACKTNITLIEQLNQRLNHQQESVSFKRAIQNNLNDSIIFISPSMEILDMNSVAETTLGYSNDEVQYQPLDQVLVAETELYTKIKNTTQNNNISNIGEVRIISRSGQNIPAHIRAIPIKHNNTLQSIALLVSDLSKHEEFRARTKQLEQQALLGEVTAIFAHEVRNPINNISTGLQLMAINFPEDDPVQEQINRLQQDCNRLADLMKSVLSFSKSREYKMDAIDLNGYLENIFERWRPRLNRYNIEYHIQIAKSTPKVFGDKRALEQVLTNLISNAINAMKPQNSGLLAVKIEPCKNTGMLNMISIDISDTGPGIPPEIGDKIFAPFFTTSKEGTGLGLAITKQIISAHGGYISVESFPGGTVFHLNLPMAPT